MAVQVKLEDQIPFVDAEVGSCDGSVSSVGTGSLLGHSSTSSEEFASKNDSNEQLWKKSAPNEDQDSLNNILDTVSSSLSLDGGVKDEPPCKTISDYDTIDGCQSKSSRPTSMSLQNRKKKDSSTLLSQPSLMTAYTLLSEQVYSTII